MGQRDFYSHAIGNFAYPLVNAPSAKIEQCQSNGMISIASLTLISAPIAVFHCSYKFFKIDIQKVQECHQPRNGNAICSFFIFLNLLRCDTRDCCQFCLSYAVFLRNWRNNPPIFWSLWVSLNFNVRIFSEEMLPPFSI